MICVIVARDAFQESAPIQKASMRNERQRNGWPFWFTVFLLALSALYIASSGPARMLSIRSGPRTMSLDRGWHGITFSYEPRDPPWWYRVYAPLVWFAEKPIGRPIHWYWDFFPHREDAA